MELHLSILFYNFFNLILKRQTKMVIGTSISYLYNLLPFFMRAIPKGLTLDYVCMFYVYVMCMFRKSPQVTLCSWRGYITYKPSSSSSRNKQTIFIISKYVICFQTQNAVSRLKYLMEGRPEMVSV